MGSLLQYELISPRCVTCTTITSSRERGGERYATQFSGWWKNFKEEREQNVKNLQRGLAWTWFDFGATLALALRALRRKDIEGRGGGSVALCF